MRPSNETVVPDPRAALRPRDEVDAKLARALGLAYDPLGKHLRGRRAPGKAR